MKLYSVGRSPFAARVRAVIGFKQLPIELSEPPQEGVKGPAYLALNPIGKLPVLVLDDGATLPESEVICEYLENRFPTPSLRPDDEMQLARSRLLARIGEIYVMIPVFALFPQLAPATRSDAIVESLFGQIRDGLGHLDRYLSDDNYAIGPALSIADTALPPFFFWVGEISRMFGRSDPTGEFPRLERYRQAMAEDPLLGPIVTDMARDLAALRNK